jgi:hypothetical protein
LISFRIEPILCAAPQAEHPGTFSRTILSPASETPAKKNSTPITENSTVIFFMFIPLLIYFNSQRLEMQFQFTIDRKNEICHSKIQKEKDDLPISYPIYFGIRFTAEKGIVTADRVKIQNHAGQH